jgi:Tol biopolymer transport system component
VSRLDRGFDALGSVRSPELWKGIQQREPRPLPEGSSLGARLVTVAVAFAVAIAGVTFGIRAFRTDTSAVGPGTVNGIIAFTAIPDGTEIPQVYSVRPDGSLPRQLTEDPTIKGSLEWSPDGSELAFVSVEPGLEAFEVVSVMAADGSGRRVLCEGCSASILVASCSDCGNTPDQVQPSSNALHWSPDGSLIAAPAYRRVGTDDYEDGINLIDVVSGDATFVPTGDRIQGLSWSPDGGSIAVGIYGPDDALGGISVLDRETRELRSITGRDDLSEGASSPDRDPVWSPDGSHIAFTREVVIPSEGGRLSTEQIFVMRADGEDQRPLTSPEAISYPSDVIWRPDGQALTILAAPADTPGEGSDSVLFDVSIADSTTSELMDCSDRPADTPCPSGDLAWSPDSRELAFQADGFGGGDEPAGFFVMRPGELPHLISGELSLRVPTATACCLAWQALPSEADVPAPAVESPAPPPPEAKANGEIFFRVGGGDSGARWDAVRPNGGGHRTVFPVGHPVHFDRISWSPDGTRMAFHNFLVGHYGLYTADSDGRNLMQLTDRYGDFGASWSPDGRQIVFSRLRDPENCGPGDTMSVGILCASDLFVINADGSGLRQLTRDGPSDFDPAWSPDGSSIAFDRLIPEEGSKVGIFLTDLEGNVHPLAIAEGGSNARPSWSPDGGQVVYESVRFEDWGIYVVNADGSGERRLAGGGVAAAAGITYAVNPVWSPDGTRIAFVGNTERIEALFTISVRGEELVVLARADSYGIAGDLAWRPRIGTG